MKNLINCFSFYCYFKNSFTKIFSNLGHVYEAKNDLRQAKQTYERKRECILSPLHPDLIENKYDNETFENMS